MNRLKLLCRKTRCGFTLMHMLAAFPLLAIFLLIGTKLFISNNQLLLQADGAEQRLIYTDQAINMLREDVWLSTSLRMEGLVLIIKQPTSKIQWSIDTSGGLTRSVNGSIPEQTFNGIKAIEIDARPSFVVIKLAEESFLCPSGHTEQSNDREGKP